CCRNKDALDCLNFPFELRKGGHPLLDFFPLANGIGPETSIKVGDDQTQITEFFLENLAKLRRETRPPFGINKVFIPPAKHGVSVKIPIPLFTTCYHFSGM